MASLRAVLEHLRSWGEVVEASLACDDHDLLQLRYITARDGFSSSLSSVSEIPSSSPSKVGASKVGASKVGAEESYQPHLHQNHPHTADTSAQTHHNTSSICGSTGVVLSAYVLRNIIEEAPPGGEGRGGLYDWRGLDSGAVKSPVVVMLSVDLHDLGGDQHRRLREFLARQSSYMIVRHLKRSWSLAMSFICGAPQQALTAVGVTGTNGKTSTVLILHQLLEMAQIPHLVVGTFGYRLGGGLTEVSSDSDDGESRPRALHHHTTPDPDFFYPLLRWARNRGARWLVMEMSSHSLTAEKLYGLEFAVVIATSFSQDHLDHHGDMKGYFAAKKKLFYPPYALSDALSDGSKSFHGSGLRGVESPPRKTLKLITAQVRDSARELFLNHSGSDPAGGRCSFDGCGRSGGDDIFVLEDHVSWRYLPEEDHALHIEFAQCCHHGSQMRELRGPIGALENRTVVVPRSPYVGAVMQKNLVISLWIFRELGFSLPTSEQLSGMRPVSGRMNVCSHRPVVVVDYAHTPSALGGALRDMREAFGPGHLIVVFGCGGDRDRSKRPSMGRQAAEVADEVWITSDNSRSESFEAIAADIGVGLAMSTDVGINPGGGELVGEALLKQGQRERPKQGPVHPEVYVCEDRGLAIVRALESAYHHHGRKHRVMVLIAGKGDERVQITGKVRRQHCDRDVVARYIKGRRES